MMIGWSNFDIYHTHLMLNDTIHGNSHMLMLEALFYNSSFITQIGRYKIICYCNIVLLLYISFNKLKLIDDGI